MTTRTLSSAATECTAASILKNDKRRTEVNGAVGVILVKNRISLIIRNFRRRDITVSVIWNSLNLAAEK